MNAVIKPVRNIVLAGIILAGFVTAPVFAQGTLTPEQLSLRVERLTELSQRSEAKLSAVQTQMKTLSEDMSRLGRLVDNRAMLDMIQQVDEISEEIRHSHLASEYLHKHYAKEIEWLTEIIHRLQSS